MKLLIVGCWGLQLFPHCSRCSDTSDTSTTASLQRHLTLPT
jgi:hypothetical protein